jgi:hypothetical protein
VPTDKKGKEKSLTIYFHIFAKFAQLCQMAPAHRYFYPYASDTPHGSLLEFKVIRFQLLHVAVPQN